MITYGKIENGSVVGQVVRAAGDPAPDDGVWLPVVVEISEYNPFTHYEVGREDIIEPDRVVRRPILAPIPVTVDMIKAEAQRRIIAVTGGSDLTGSLIRQINDQARLIELMATPSLDMSQSEFEEMAAIRARKLAITHIRERSNVLEASLPSDYMDEALWA